MSILSELRSATNGNAMGRSIRRLFKSSTVLSESDKELASGYMAGDNEFTIVCPVVNRLNDKSSVYPFELLGEIVEVKIETIVAVHNGAAKWYMTKELLEHHVAIGNCKQVMYSDMTKAPYCLIYLKIIENGKLATISPWLRKNPVDHNIVTFRTRLSKTQLKNILTYTPYKILRVFADAELADE